MQQIINMSIPAGHNRVRHAALILRKVLIKLIYIPSIDLQLYSSSVAFTAQ